MSFENKVKTIVHNMPKVPVLNYSTYNNNNHNLNSQNNQNNVSTSDMPKENPNNIRITKEACNSVLQSYGLTYQVKNIELFQRAFVHTSYLIDDTVTAASASASAASAPNHSTNTAIVPLQPESYERLEYIGDAILNAATAHYVFERYPSEDEGFMTTLRTKLVRSKTLARITKKLKLHKYILLSLYTDKVINGRNNRKNLEDVFEAFIGALYLDCGPETGFVTCLKFISNVFERWIDMVNMISRDDNYKKNLLEYYQKRFRTEAKYQIISVRGKKPHKIYTMGALSPTGEIIGIGQAKKKVDADQMASKQALIYYGEEVEESEEDSISS